MCQKWKDSNENNIKEKMVDPQSRKGIFNAIKAAIKYGSLYKAKLLFNPVFLFLTVTKKVSNKKNEARIRSEVISELKTELEILDEKIRDADRIIGLLEANELKRCDLIVNRIRVDMVKRGEMMSIDDVVEILSINLIGAVPDDENIVISTNQGEPLVGSNSMAGRAYMDICRRLLGEEVEFEENKPISMGKIVVIGSHINEDEIKKLF